jgi:Myo-inositol-1-phosphate synthase
VKIWIVGARGAIASTLAVGTLAAQRGMTSLEGLLTETPPFQGMGLVELHGTEFGGCDLSPGTLAETAQDALVGVGCFPPPMIESLMPDLQKVNITRGILRGGGPAIDALAHAERAATAAGTARAAVERIASDIRTFANGEPTVVVNLASTEPVPAPALFTWSAADLEAALDADDPRIPASLLYVYASLHAGCPHANFTPSGGASIPAIVELARSLGLPLAGRDGKTGETLMKTALAPMFPIAR